MDHAEAQRWISDWSRGRLDAARARAIEAHVRDCPECAAAAEAAVGLDAEGRRLAAEPAAHPASETLARYVETPGELGTAALARVGAHVRACASCREDVALMREAAAPAWWRAIRSWLAVPGAPVRALQPALALSALLLAYPAWVGLVEHPRERANAERRLHESEARARDVARAAPPAAAPRGGGVAALVLRGATRGGDELPVLRLRAGQALQPVLVDAAPPGPRLAIALVREPGTRVWAIEGQSEDFWDPVNELLGMQVPADLLTPGDYRLELGVAAGGTPKVTARFRVSAAPPGAASR